MASATDRFDVLIVGAGPAGLSAALILGRCCRRVLLCDRGTPRAWASGAMHGFISRDGCPPQDLAAMARSELARYGVACEDIEVREALRTADGFDVRVGERIVHTRKLLIATGLQDQLPDIEGFVELFGTSVFQCPYCDGWDFRGRALAAYGRGARGFEMARSLTAWSDDVVLCCNGPSGLDREQRQHLAGNDIRVVATPIARLEQEDAALRSIIFRDGEVLARDAIFFDTPSQAQSDLATKPGCTFNQRGGVVSGQHEATAVPGVYVAGNIIRNVQLAIVAAAEGANAAFGINRALTREDFIRRATGAQVVEHTAPAG